MSHSSQYRPHLSNLGQPPCVPCVWQHESHKLYEHGPDEDEEEIKEGEENEEKESCQKGRCCTATYK